MRKKYPKSKPDLHLDRKVNFHAGNVSVLKSGVFLKACKMSGAKPSLRQASKFRRGFGLAHSCK